MGPTNWGSRAGSARYSALLAAVLAISHPAGVAAQARPPLRNSVDSTGVLSAIRAIDLRQLCRCPTVVLDSVVRRGAKARMFHVLDLPAAFTLSSEDVGLLRLARHRVVRGALRGIPATGPDTAFVAVQVVQPSRAGRRILVVATPPTGLTAAYLVSLIPHRATWRVQGVQSVFDP